MWEFIFYLYTIPVLFKRTLVYFIAVLLTTLFN